MNLKAKLAKLEQVLGKGRCPYCLLHTRHSWIGRNRPRPTRQPVDEALIVRDPCELCGAIRCLSLASLPVATHGIFRLGFEATMEAEYTDARVWTAKLWVSYWFAATDQVKKKRPQGGYQPQRAERARAKLPDVKLYHKVKAEGDAALQRKRKRLERQHGQPFPELKAQIEAIKEPDYDALTKGQPWSWKVGFEATRQLQHKAKLWLVCMELERIALGESLPESAAALADVERQMHELIADAQRRYEDEQATERERQAQRERERAAWQAQAASVKPAPHNTVTPQPAPAADPHPLVCVPALTEGATLPSDGIGPPPPMYETRFHDWFLRAVKILPQAAGESTAEYVARWRAQRHNAAQVTNPDWNSATAERMRQLVRHGGRG